VNVPSMYSISAAPQAAWEGAGGQCCRDRSGVGGRRLRQRCCPSWYAWLPKGRWRCGSLVRSGCEAREEAKSLLPPPRGPTQVGTTPELVFRAVIGADGEDVNLEFAL
jgi:hypothetical protein